MFIACGAASGIWSGQKMALAPECGMGWSAGLPAFCPPHFHCLWCHAALHILWPKTNRRRPQRHREGGEKQVQTKPVVNLCVLRALCGLRSRKPANRQKNRNGGNGGNAGLRRRLITVAEWRAHVGRATNRKCNWPAGRQQRRRRQRRFPAYGQPEGRGWREPALAAASWRGAGSPTRGEPGALAAAAARSAAGPRRRRSSFQLADKKHARAGTRGLLAAGSGHAPSVPPLFEWVS